MKTFKFLHLAFIAALGVSVVFTQVSCENNNDDVEDNEYSVSGTATGSQEVPANSSSGSATLTGTYNANNNTLNYSISWTGLTGILSAAHFHGPAAIGVNAGPIHDIMISVNGTTGTAGGSIILHDSTEAHLLGGRLYYNLHTAAYPGGEVRSQVITGQ